jgi:hypothetical protein
MNQKTTIWKSRSDGTVLLESLHGLPFGAPSMADKINIPKYGEVQCTGISRSGTGSNEKITEVKFTIL